MIELRRLEAGLIELIRLEKESLEKRRTGGRGIEGDRIEREDRRGEGVVHFLAKKIILEFVK